MPMEEAIVEVNLLPFQETLGIKENRLQERPVNWLRRM